ncbi:cation:proton antiporter [Nocardioides sp. YIM 152588]|uniref:cation:proton antiporter domain-containing protein n=1 Tax=Nocardioides sp. YIM 152588 TaxID=3158259 RepID=UPI0032E4AF1A
MSVIAQVLLQLALIIVVARVAGALVSRIGIPAVVGEIGAGILLGPTVLGGLSAEIFPIEHRDLLQVLANLGLVLFMFVIGLELDVSVVRGRGRVAGSVSALSIALPFTLGIGLAVLLDDLRPEHAGFWPFALFLGAAMSITAFPVLARILTDRRMQRTETGGLALASAATDDVLAWTLLAAVIGVAGATMPHAAEGGGHHGPSWLVLLAVPFVLVAILLVRPQLARLTRMYARAGELTPALLSIVLVGLLVFAAITELIGIHFIFGAFLWGAIMPHEGAAAMRHEILVRLEQLSVLLLLPVFFLIAGLGVDIRGLSAQNLVQLLAILAVAITGKYAGAYLGARSAGVPHWQANALGILMNTRGLTEIIILTVGAELGLIGEELFTMMVVMALVTTVMTGPLINLAYPARRVARDIAEAERAALGAEAVDRVLVLGRRDRPGEVALELATILLAAASDREGPREVVVAELEPQGRRLALGSGLSGELADVAAAMERQEVLVRRGAEAGVPVRVIAHPSGDVEADLAELVRVLAPQGLVLWAGDPARAAVLAAADCPVAVLADDTDALPERAPVEVVPGAGADGEAALVLGARVALARGVPLAVPADGPRRLVAARATLAARGVEVVEPPAADPATGLAPPTLLVAADGTEPAPAIGAAAVPDAAPTDFATVPLGVLAPST